MTLNCAPRCTLFFSGDLWALVLPHNTFHVKSRGSCKVFRVFERFPEKSVAMRLAVYDARDLSALAVFENKN